jgi:uncharacterized protein (TIGR03083 family)
MTPVDHLVALRRDADRIAGAAQDQFGRTVPSCPGWQINDLVWHVGIVHMFWRMVASGALSGPDAWTEPDRPHDGDLIAWFRDGVDRAATILADLDSRTPAWTWGHRQDVGFIRRRVSQETTVHCWDAVNAIGCTKPIEQGLAVDGVDEFFDEVLPALSHDLEGPAQTICLHAHDCAHQWTVRVGEGSSQLTPACGHADAEVTGTASDLLLLLWHRRSPDQMHIVGDIAALQRFLARAAF